MKTAIATTSTALRINHRAQTIELTKALAKEVGLSGVRVNCIAPGAINVRHRDDAQLKYPYAEMVPMGRWGVEADIGNAAAFLLNIGLDSGNNSNALVRAGKLHILFGGLD